ncbi:MAG: SAM-dependent chlorinase/fluorinase [Planctomycetota bacterium]|nr:SAM-dependent chlorinase/fluorinase [Planctomycetota bacterium]
MPKQRIITLLTDFGWSGPYAAEMKGVILNIVPSATVVDITHDIPQGDILAGAFVLRQVLPYFPAGSIHCVVVDPTVGTDRRIIAAKYAGQTIILPDNGLISLVEQDQTLEQIVVVRNQKYFFTPAISSTFHGRDVIAPAAAHLADGLAMDRLGPMPDKFTLLDIPAPHVDADGSLVGRIIYVDHFGNLISDISAQLLQSVWGGEQFDVEVSLKGGKIGLLKAAYAFAESGEPLALINSMALVEIAINSGRACNALSAGVGAEIRLIKQVHKV